MESSDINEELGINALNRKPKSQLLKGLESNEALWIVVFQVGGIFFSVVLWMLKLRFVMYILPFYVLAIMFLIRILRHFHKTEKPGYIVSLLNYLMNQPKKVYVRTGRKIFQKKS